MKRKDIFLILGLLAVIFAILCSAVIAEPVLRSIPFTLLIMAGCAGVAVFLMRHRVHGEHRKRRQSEADGDPGQEEKERSGVASSLTDTDAAMAQIIHGSRVPSSVMDNHREKETCRALLEQFPVGISLIAADGTYEYVNPKFIELFGYALEDISTGTHWFRQAFPDTQERAKVTALWVADTRRCHQGEMRPRTFWTSCKNGDRKLIQYKPVTLHDGTHLITYDDITEQHELENRFQLAQKQEAIGALASGIAHDFNNILFPIIGFTELLHDDIPEDSPLRTSVDEIWAASQRARELVRQILTFSRQSETEIQPLQVSIIIKEVIKLVRASLPATIEIHQTIDSDNSMILADPTQIHQVVINLITNAFHSMEDTGGTLSITLEQVHLDHSGLMDATMIPGKYARLTVDDTGHGMKPNLLERIFDPYFTTKEKGKGNGLGLSVVLGIVKNCGGAITVTSEPGKGSCFRIFLPEIQTTGVTDETTELDALPSGSESILVVDDEPPIVKMEKAILDRLGYRITTMTSSLEALEAFREKPHDYDLVITDMTMPKMTGLQLAQALKGIRSDIKIIISTGFSEQINSQMARSFGIENIIFKPIVREELARVIRRVLDKDTMTTGQRDTVVSEALSSEDPKYS